MRNLRQLSQDRNPLTIRRTILNVRCQQTFSVSKCCAVLGCALLSCGSCGFRSCNVKDMDVNEYATFSCGIRLIHPV